jgi:hypothetical protein
VPDYDKQNLRGEHGRKKEEEEGVHGRGHLSEDIQRGPSLALYSSSTGCHLEGSMCVDHAITPS